MQSASSSSLSFTESVISDLSCQILLLISSYPLLCCPARVTATLYSSIYLTLKAQIVLLTLFSSGQRRASPLLHELLWLPVRAHIDYMIATLCYCCLRGLTPEGQGDRCLATWVAACLSVLCIRWEKSGRHSFSGPIWNYLPLSFWTVCLKLSSLASKQISKNYLS